MAGVLTLTRPIRFRRDRFAANSKTERSVKLLQSMSAKLNVRNLTGADREGRRNSQARSTYRMRVQARATAVTARSVILPKSAVSLVPYFAQGEGQNAPADMSEMQVVQVLAQPANRVQALVRQAVALAEDEVPQLRAVLDDAGDGCVGEAVAGGEVEVAELVEGAVRGWRGERSGARDESAAGSRERVGTGRSRAR
jgi:hypothetical protein